MSIRISLFTLVYIFLFSNAIFAQGISRSGYPSPEEDLNSLRRFPCGGITILNETVQSSELPNGWGSEDLDNGNPNERIQFLFPEGGWQVSKDLKDTTNGNLVFASPSWYEGSEASNDWLIAPKIENLPANTCLSWYAYSVDQFFPEDYEIWISNGDSTPAAFLSGGTMIESVEGEGTEFTFRSISLADYVGQSVFIAFRHTSQDKYALALDEIRLAQVENIDMAIFGIDEIRAKANENVSISGAFINRGLDTVSVDSNSFLNIFYSVDGQDTNRYAYPTAFALAPNDTLTFVHDSVWTPTESKVYRIRVWLERTNGDNNAANDTLGFWQGIGTATPVEEETLSGLQVFPNPVKGHVVVSWENPASDWEALLFDSYGKKIKNSGKQFGHELKMNLEGISRGIYILQITSSEGIVKNWKLLVE